ncbi:AAA family ATPase [Staphylococcus simulans]|uniref:AAA family ATPase n=1 Tax=Staphylococcus simulans TaxID=1286 RepID=UPI0021CE4898|nr:AAA family ATPase [Staphylococcus simulans]UXR29863.1 AAA family ATPase [Staphylococcus simulans]
MSFNITSAKDIQTDKATYLIYAKPGTGKTHTLNFLPGRTLYINVDKSERPLKGNENIAIDNISELFRSMLANLGRNGKNERVPEMSHYQRVDFFTIDSLRFLQSLKKRLVFLAWETNYENYTPAGQQITQAVPDIRKTIRDNVAGLCQVVARLVFNEKSGKRGFILTPSNNVFAKNQLDNREHCLQEDLFKVGDDNNGD